MFEFPLLETALTETQDSITQNKTKFRTSYFPDHWKFNADSRDGFNHELESVGLEGSFYLRALYEQ